MMSYATELRSMTQGNGSYVQEFLRYERAPKDVADRVIAAAKEEWKKTTKTNSYSLIKKKQI